MGKFKRFFAIILSFALLCGGAALFGACGEEEIPDGNNYTITRKYRTSTDTYTAVKGKSFNLGTTSRTGYRFIGWYDKEKGGEPVTDAEGKSLSTFVGGRSLTVYPHYVPKIYTVVFEYGYEIFAELQVPYGEEYEVPFGVPASSREFKCWVIRDGNQYVAISNEYEPLKGKNVLNNTYFTISDSTSKVYVEAMFKDNYFNQSK